MGMCFENYAGLSKLKGPEMCLQQGFELSTLRCTLSWTSLVVGAQGLLFLLWPTLKLGGRSCYSEESG